MNTCKTCKYWSRTDGSIAEIVGATNGSCACDKMVYTGDNDKECPKDGMAYWDSECWGAGFRTGEDFGCIHHKE